MAYNDYDWTTRSGNLGPKGSDPYWSGFMNDYNIGGNGGNLTKSYSWTIRFNNYGRQTFRTAVDDYGGLYINGVQQFQMGSYGGETYLTTPGYFSPGDYTITVESINSGGGPWGVAADWTGYVPPPAPTVQLYLNGYEKDLDIVQGSLVNVVWASTNPGFSVSGSISTSPSVPSINGSGLPGSGGKSTTAFPLGSTNVTFTGTTAGQSSSITRKVTAYATPVINSFTLSPSPPRFNTNTFTLSWQTTDAVSVSLSGTSGAFGTNLPSSLAVDGSHVFSGVSGGTYTVTLTAVGPWGNSSSPNGPATVSQSITYTVYDETPNSFEFDDKLDASVLARTNIESNTIVINGFGPTTYDNSNLPIKSNYPIQVMVNGDGIWRNVEQI